MPAASWLPILLIHIRSHVITRQSYKLKFFAKNSNFVILQKTLQATSLLKLLDKMCKYEMHPSSIVEDTRWTQFCPQTDGQMDRQTTWNQYTPFQLRWSGGIIKHQHILCCTLLMTHISEIHWHRDTHKNCNQTILFIHKWDLGLRDYLNHITIWQ